MNTRKFALMVALIVATLLSACKPVTVVSKAVNACGDITTCATDAPQILNAELCDALNGYKTADGNCHSR
jgi:hypothetical protein